MSETIFEAFRKKPIGGVVIALIVATAIIAGYFFLSTFEFNPELRHRGQQLHAEIEQKYYELRSHELQPNGSIKFDNAPHNLSSVVMKYIPIGTSFKDAERILRAAGVKMAADPPRPPRPTDPYDDRYNIRGGFDLTFIFPGKLAFVIVVYPQNLGGLNTTVAKIDAFISQQSL